MSAHSATNSAFLEYLDKLIDDLHHDIPQALRAFETDAIHDSRVATRRLKAAMDLLNPVLSDRHCAPLEKVLKKLRRKLGPLRDLDVMIEHLGKMSSSAAAQWVRDELVKCRDEEHEQIRKKKSGPAQVLAKLGAWWPVREEVAEAVTAIDSLLSQSLHLQLDGFSEQAAQLQHSPSHHGLDPHQLRIAGKLLRYTLELAKAQGHKLPSAVLRAFKKMQDALGTWHDHVALGERILSISLEREVAYHDPQLKAQLLKLTQTLIGRAQRDLAKFSALWRQHGDEIANAIRDRFPLTHAVTSPQTGPDPSGSDGTATPAQPSPDVASSA